MNDKLTAYNEKMDKTLEHLSGDYMSIRAGRANPHVLDKIKVDYYGTPTPLQSVGNITVPEPRMIQIAPWEKTMIKEIEKAIMASDLGRRSVRIDVEASVLVISFDKINILEVDKEEVIARKKDWIDTFASIYRKGQDE